MQATAMRNHGMIIEIKMMAPRTPDVVATNMRNESAESQSTYAESTNG